MPKYQILTKEYLFNINLPILQQTDDTYVCVGRYECLAGFVTE